jgi:hypothetical protein
MSPEPGPRPRGREAGAAGRRARPAGARAAAAAGPQTLRAAGPQALRAATWQRALRQRQPLRHEGLFRRAHYATPPRAGPGSVLLPTGHTPTQPRPLWGPHNGPRPCLAGRPHAAVVLPLNFTLQGQPSGPNPLPHTHPPNPPASRRAARAVASAAAPRVCVVGVAGPSPFCLSGNQSGMTAPGAASPQRPLTPPAPAIPVLWPAPR